MVRPKKSQLPAAPTGLPYGKAGALRAAQKEVPIQAAPGVQAAPTPPGNQSPGPGAPPQGPTAGGRAMDLATALGGMAPAGALLDPDATTGNPNEPVTAGLPMGAGTDQLSALDTDTGPDPDLIAFAEWLPMMEVLASRPGSSGQLRQLVRRVRSQLPAGYDWSAGAEPQG